MCKDNLPRVAEWREAYRDAGLRVIAIHMPRYPEDMNVDSVRDAVAKYEINDALAVDNEHKLRDAFQNENGYVPAYYLFDEQHKLKSFAAGEFGVKVIAPAIERMLGAQACRAGDGIKPGRKPQGYINSKFVSPRMGDSDDNGRSAPSAVLF